MGKHRQPGKLKHQEITQIQAKHHLPHLQHQTHFHLVNKYAPLMPPY